MDVKSDDFDDGADCAMTWKKGKTMNVEGVEEDGKAKRVRVRVRGGEKPP